MSVINQFLLSDKFLITWHNITQSGNSARNIFDFDVVTIGIKFVFIKFFTQKLCKMLEIKFKQNV